jgi:putative flavoprotein involved in K+ transport
MRRTDVVVIGGGQAGLAASFCLSARGIDHVVIERGRIAERWRSATWDSLRMQTPRYQSRLPGWRYTGNDPHGYMSMRELIAYLEAYARSFAAPIYEGTAVRAVTRVDDGFHVDTDGGAWRARAVIVATGHCDVPRVPGFAHEIAPSVHQVTASDYRRPERLPPGGVLVVGASASGALIADELASAGRDVTLSVGHHTRMPRHHRGRDIYWWLDVMGVLHERSEEVRDLAAARRQPSMQLAGSPAWRSIDLASLQGRGVRLVGRLAAAKEARVTFAGDLASTVAEADTRAASVLARIDRFARTWEIDPRGPAASVNPLGNVVSPSSLDLAAEGIGTVVWACGFSRDYRWLEVPGVVADGELVHDGGITPVPGLYGLGLRFMRRRNSSFLDGVGIDAATIVGHLAVHLDRQRAA